MNTRVATALAGGAAIEATKKLGSSLRDGLGGEEPALVLAFASTSQPLSEVTGGLTKEFPTAMVLGASTAGEFTEKGDVKGSVSAFAVSGDFKIFAGTADDLKADPGAAVQRAVGPLPSTWDGYPHKTGILLLDPLSGNGEEVTLLIAACVGADEVLVGGAAGDDLQMKSTHVALGAVAAGDSLVFARIFSRSPLGLGVCHGHSPLSAPVRVTKASGNVVFEIDGRPAWDVWRELTRASAAARGVDTAKIPKQDEGAYLLRYEAGIAAGGEYKIRAPLARSPDGSISFACGIPEGTVIRITESTPEAQVASARSAASRARGALRGKQVAGALVFDCICRNLILGAEFTRAVKGMAEELGHVPVAGFETYGEIALAAGDMSGFHNTSSVVLAFPRE
jgi:methyl-accepting chemotaxis protein